MLSWMSQALHLLDSEQNTTVARTDVLDYLSYAASVVSWCIGCGAMKGNECGLGFILLLGR